MKINNLNDICSFYQRILVFEDPFGKWLNLVKSSHQSSSADFLSSLKSSKFVNNDCDSSRAVQLVNVLFAYTEAKRFELSVFQKLNELRLDKVLPEQRVDYWKNIAQIDTYLAQWLTIAEIYWPDWTNLIGFGKKDNRIEFLDNCRKGLTKHAKDWQTSVAIFNKYLCEARSQLPSDFLPKALILVEGLTEQFLLPYFALSNGMNLSSIGIMIVPAGGANKIIRKYYYWKERTSLPIFCLFDADAYNLANSLMANLRASDSVYTLVDGEIEDIMKLEFLVHQINNYLSDDPLYDKSKPVSVEDFSNDEKRTLILDKIWRKRELGKFEKVKFAQFLSNQPYSNGYDFLSHGGKDMLNKLANALKVQ